MLFDVLVRYTYVQSKSNNLVADPASDSCLVIIPDQPNTYEGRAVFNDYLLQGAHRYSIDFGLLLSKLPCGKFVRVGFFENQHKGRGPLFKGNEPLHDIVII